MAEGPERGIDYSTKGAAVGASLHSFGLFQDARARMPMLHRWSVTGSPFHSAAAPIKRRAVGGLGWICPQRKKNFRRAARGSALASSENYLCGLLLAATHVHLAANRARVRWARMLGLPVMWIVLLSSLSLLFSPSPSLLPLFPATTSKERWIFRAPTLAAFCPIRKPGLNPLSPSFH